MAGKSNISATFFAQKKLLGKAHTSNLKVDGEEVIGSNVQASTSLIFGQAIPTSPSLTLNSVQSSTVEYIQFDLVKLDGTTYNANSTGGGSGTDSGENSQSSGPHTYQFRLPSNYETATDNSAAGNGVFDNSKIVHETLGALQLVPPFFSRDSPNPYIVKIYKDNGSGGLGDEIPLLDNIDWNVDFYNGILFLQDYDASKIPAFARCFAYVGQMASQVISGGGGGTPGGSNTQIQFNDSGAFAGDSNLTFNKTTDTLKTVNLSGSLTKLADGSSYLIAGANVTITTGSSGAVTIASSAGGTPAGANTQIQFNNNGSFGSSSDLTWNGSLLNVQGDAVLNGTVVINQSGADKDFRVETQNKVHALQVDGGTDMVLLFSGSNTDAAGFGSSATDPDPKTFTDTNFFVSGSIGSRGSSTKGTSVFGGDIFVSGTIHGIDTNHVLVSDDSSLPNARVITAGDGITISTATPRQIKISSTRTKKYYDITGSHAANQPLDCHGLNFSNVNYNPNLIDVFYNGVSVRSGSSHDYELHNTGSIKFKFQLFLEDTIQVVVF